MLERIDDAGCDDDNGEVPEAAAVLPGAEPPAVAAAVGLQPALTARLQRLPWLRLTAALLVIAGGLVVWLGAASPPTAVPTDPFAPQLLEIERPAAVPTEPAAADEAAPRERALIVVYISGAVVAPDVYRLAADARVIDGIAAAGGVTVAADLRSINLARPLQDAEQLDVPTLSEAAPAPAAVPAVPAADGGGRINVNRATAAQLQELPGIGPALAARIIAHREANGPFADTTALGEVSGIGERIMTEIAERVDFTP
jgi:competence protein ComEA